MRRTFWEPDQPILRLLQHLALWVLSFFIFLNLFKSGVKPEKVDYLYTTLFHLTLLPAVYINLELLLPWFRNNNKWIFYLAFLGSIVVLFTWINFRFFNIWSAKLFPDYFFISYFTFREIALFFFIYIIITTLLKLSKSWFHVNWLQRELLEKERQKTDVELKALKAQINPHFFFNTLNSIYSMSLDKDERLPRTILQLSEIMRYFLYDSRDHFVALEKEIKVIQDYAALQKIRSENGEVIEFNQIGELKNQKIAPLLLITFLENAFKHSAKNESGEKFIKTEIMMEPGKMNFSVINSKGIIDNVNIKNHAGLGLENVKRQLELLYPGRHRLEIKDSYDCYAVTLQLEL